MEFEWAHKQWKWEMQTTTNLDMDILAASSQV